MSEGKQLAYRVRDWSKTFETSDSRDYKSLNWISLPIDLNSRQYMRLMQREDGGEVFGLWTSILMLAAQCNENRGTLADKDGPYTFEDMSMITHIPTDKLKHVFEVLTSKEINWMETVEWGQPTESEPGDAPVTTDCQPGDDPTSPECETPITKHTKPITQPNLLPDQTYYPDTAPAETNDLISIEKDFISKWNSLGGVKRNKGSTLTDSRRRSFRARLKDKDWDWKEAFKKFPLKSTVGNPNQWKPDMDWILKPDNVTKILEGKYDFDWNTNSGTASGNNNPSRYHGTTDFSL